MDLDAQEQLDFEIRLKEFRVLDDALVARAAASRTNRNEGTNITELSPELLANIFKHISQRDLVWNVMFVCRRFKDAVHLPTLWKNLKFSFCRSPLTNSVKLEVEKVLQKAVLVEHLCLDIVGDVTKILVRVSRRCRRLQHLRLGFCSVGSKLPIQLIISNCPHLISLDLIHTRGKHLNCFDAMTTLESLQMVSCTWPEPRFLRNLSESSAANFKILVFNRMKCFTDNSVTSFLRNHRRFLNELSLDAYYLRTPTMDAISNCEGLRRLTIDCGQHLIDPELAILASMEGLCEIAIRNAKKITGEGWKFFLERLDATQIDCVELCMVQNRMMNVEAIIIGNRGTILHRAKTINLSGTSFIYDRMVDVILTKNPYVESLTVCYSNDFIGNCFKDKDETYACNLKFLDVSGCTRLNYLVVREFKEKRNNLELRYDVLH